MKISVYCIYCLFIIVSCLLSPVLFTVVVTGEANTSLNSDDSFLFDNEINNISTSNSDSNFQYIGPNHLEESEMLETEYKNVNENLNSEQLDSSFSESNSVQSNNDKSSHSTFQQIIPDSVSQNSGTLNEYSDTGQILLTIVDSASAELKNTAAESQSEIQYSTESSKQSSQNHSTLASHHVPLIPIKHSTSNLSENFLENKVPVKNSTPAEEIEDHHTDDVEEHTTVGTTIIDNDIKIIPESETKDKIKISVEIEENVTEEQVIKSPISETASSTTGKPVVEEQPTIVIPSVTIKTEEPLEKPEKGEDIPSFAEWAQKQLEEAEKKKEIQNISFQNSQSNRSNGRPTSNLKLRSKNYASPDCGAKIVAVNAEATSPSSVLSPSKDEYMLNPCTSRIWFVVELCEAVQAKRVELANFELFSSTPKDFSVYVSDRFPTRDWNSVGQFTAKDERDVQMYDLHPHIFGKYVKVELHSHYGSEHFCPISLFRLYGTSEYEVLETEDENHSEENPDDDEFVEEPLISTEKQQEPSNLFGSAREVVMSLVKKAAQVLVMTSDSSNRTTQRTVDCNLPKLPITEKCQTPSHLIVCDNCSDLFFGNVFSLLSCRNNFLKQISDSVYVSKAITDTDICVKFGLNFNSKGDWCSARTAGNTISSFFGPEYVAALCNILAIREKKVVLNASNSLFTNLTENDIGTFTNQNIVEPQLTPIYEEKTLDNESKFDDNNVPINISPQFDTLASSINIQPTKTFKDSENDSFTKPETTIEGSETLWQPSMETGGHVETVKTKDSERDTSKRETFEASASTTNQQIEDEKKTASQESVVSQPEIEKVTESSSEGYEIVQEIDSFLSEWEQFPSNNNPVTTAPVTPPSNLPQGQKESVFVRLFNRIKALERNMSLSSQYLEELSRRYKKQMEEMQRAFEKTLAVVNEESKKSEEFRRKYYDTQSRLDTQLASLTSAVELLMAERNSWTNVASWFMNFFIAQLFIVSIILYFCGKSETKIYDSPPLKVDNESHKIAIPKRRKSVDVVRHDSPAKRRRRRPSEEALNITGTYNDLLLPDTTDGNGNGLWPTATNSKAEKRRRRKKNSILRRSNSNSTINYHTSQMCDIKENISVKSFSCVEENVCVKDTNSPGTEKQTAVTKTDVQNTNQSDDTVKETLKEDKQSEEEIVTNKVTKIENPSFMKTAISERGKRISITDNSTPDLSSSANQELTVKRTNTSSSTSNIPKEKLTNGLTRSSSVTTADSHTPKKEKKSTGGLKKILKRVF